MRLYCSSDVPAWRDVDSDDPSLLLYVHYQSVPIILAIAESNANLRRISPKLFCHSLLSGI